MKIKLLEIRDEGTFIPAIAIRLFAVADSQDEWLLRRAGYAQEQIRTYDVEEEPNDQPYVLLAQLHGGKIEYDPYAWTNRTMAVVHQCIIDQWSSLQSGDVVDVQYILKEKTSTKPSERWNP